MLVNFPHLNNNLYDKLYILFLVKMFVVIKL